MTTPAITRTLELIDEEITKLDGQTLEVRAHKGAELTARLTRCLELDRQQSPVTHEVGRLRQRIYVELLDMDPSPAKWPDLS